MSIKNLRLPAFVLACLVAGAVAVSLGTAVAEELRTGQPGDAGPSVSTLVDALPDPVVAADHAAKEESTIHNPLTHPRESFDDVVAAKKLGWPVLAIVMGAMLLYVLGAWVPALRKGAAAFLVSGAATTLAAAGDAALDGGSWVAIVTAAVITGFGVWKADREAAARDKALKVAAAS